MSTPVDQGEWLDSWPGPLIGGAMSGHSAPWLGTRQDNLCPQTDQVRSLFIGTSKRTRILYSDSSVLAGVLKRFALFLILLRYMPLTTGCIELYWHQNSALSMSSIYNEKTLKDPKHKPWLIKKNQSHLLLNNVKFIHVNIQYKQNQLITRTINKNTVVIWYIFRFLLLLFNQILLQKTVGLCSATMEGVSFLLQVCWVLEPRFIVVSYNRSPYLVTSYVTNGIKM